MSRASISALAPGLCRRMSTSRSPGKISRTWGSQPARLVRNAGWKGDKLGAYRQFVEAYWTENDPMLKEHAGYEEVVPAEVRHFVGPWKYCLLAGGWVPRSNRAALPRQLMAKFGSQP